VKPATATAAVTYTGGGLFSHRLEGDALRNAGIPTVHGLDARVDERRPEPRWPALIAVFAVVCLHMALRSDLVLGPTWLLPGVVALLLVPTVVSHQLGRHHFDRTLGFVITSLVTLALIASLVLLVAGLPSHRQTAGQLLVSAVSLWVTNILVFALWYWRLDAGGPHGRDRRTKHEEGAFLFPQMTMTSEVRRITGQQMWSPNFVDYLFVAFNTSTAFSPTDTPALTPWAKVLMMVQSVISLGVLVLLAARAVNIF
jgi:hypothetical protein